MSACIQQCVQITSKDDDDDDDEQMMWFAHIAEYIYQCFMPGISAH
jgi:hypothetical protein